MRKTTLLAAVVAALVLNGIGAWVGVRTFTPTSALAGASDRRSQRAFLIAAPVFLKVLARIL